MTVSSRRFDSATGQPLCQKPPSLSYFCTGWGSGLIEACEADGASVSSIADSATNTRSTGDDITLARARRQCAANVLRRAGVPLYAHREARHRCLCGGPVGHWTARALNDENPR